MGGGNWRNTSRRRIDNRGDVECWRGIELEGEEGTVGGSCLTSFKGTNASATPIPKQKNFFV